MGWPKKASDLGLHCLPSLQYVKKKKKKKKKNKKLQLGSCVSMYGW